MDWTLFYRVCQWKPDCSCDDTDMPNCIFYIIWNCNVARAIFGWRRHKIIILFNDVLVYACLLCIYWITAKIKWTENLWPVHHYEFWIRWARSVSAQVKKWFVIKGKKSHNSLVYSMYTENNLSGDRRVGSPWEEAAVVELWRYRECGYEEPFTWTCKLGAVNYRRSYGLVSDSEERRASRMEFDTGA